MSIRVQRKKKHNKWTNTINKAKDKQAIQLIKNIGSFIKKVSKEEEIEKTFKDFEQETLDLIYNSLEETYSITTQSIKDIYNITTKSSKIKDLTYNGDGRTLDERIQQYFSDLLNYINQEENIDWNKIKQNLNHRLMLVLDTETQTVKIKVTHKKIEGHCEFGEVLPGECCPGSGGIYPIDELDLPPFHPNCMCEVIYYEELTDDEQEIEDLELEVEQIYYE